MNRTKWTIGVIVILGIIAVIAVSVVNHQNPAPQAKTSQETKEKMPAPDVPAQPEPLVEKLGTEKKSTDSPEPPKEEGAKEGTGQDGKGKAVQDPNVSPDEKKAAEDPNTLPGEKLEMVNLNNVEMKQIIKTIAEWTGKPVVPYDDAVMNQKITIYATQKLPRMQALSLIYSALQAKGYVPEEAGGAIYLKPLSKAKYGVVPTLGVDEPLAKVVDKSQIVEKFFKIQNYSPSRLQEIVTPLTAEYGNVTADDSTGMLAIIDTVENLQRVEQIIRQYDVAEYGQFTTEVFKLENGDPSEIVQLIQLIISNEVGGRSARRGSSPSRPEGGPKGTGQASSVLVTSTKMPLLLIPDQRRKWIIAKGAPEDIIEVAKWVDELDKKDEITSEQSVVQIKYVDVIEVAQAVGKTLAEMPGSQLKANIVVQPLRQARQIVVFGSEENRKIVEALIAEIDLPTSGIFDEKTFELQYADPDQIKENIDQLYGDPQSSSRYYYSYRNNEKSSDTVKVISYPTAGKVTVIASPENIEKISKQIKEWDVPLNIERQPYRIIALQNSDSKQMAELLQTLFSEESGRSTSFWDYIYGRGSDNKKKIVGSLYGQLSFEAVPETKKIIVISKIPEAYDVIEDLVRELDRQEVAEVPKVITLKYADSEDLCEQLNAILNETGTVATVRRTRRGLSDYNNDTSTSGNNNQRTNNSNNNPDSQNSNPGEIRPWWNAGVARSQADEALPTSNLIGKVRFIPVQRSKALLVLAPPEYMDEMVTMIEELDQPGKQVMIKTVILSVDHSSVTSLGVQFSSNPFAFGDITENSARALTELTTGFERGSFTLSSGMNISTLIEFLEKHANARILNQPTLWTKDNEEAVFFRGQEVAFIENENTSTEGTASRRDYNYRPVGVTLRIRPSITPEKAVDTTINLNVSRVLPELINTNIATSSLDTTTHVIVQDGETIMLGGILFQNDSTIERKVPLLGDLPILGGAFKHNETEVTNNELLMFITPYVVENSTQIENSSIPVAEDGFKTLEQSREILQEKMTELGIDSDVEQVENK